MAKETIVILLAGAYFPGLLAVGFLGHRPNPRRIYRSMGWLLWPAVITTLLTLVVPMVLFYLAAWFEWARTLYYAYMYLVMRVEGVTTERDSVFLMSTMAGAMLPCMLVTAFWSFVAISCTPLHAIRLFRDWLQERKRLQARAARHPLPRLEPIIYPPGYSR